MSISIDGQSLSCSDVYDIAHGAEAVLSGSARTAMDENVASMPAGPSILEEKRHWLVGGTPQDFGLELLAPDLKRMLPKLELPTSATPASRRSASSRDTPRSRFDCCEGLRPAGMLPHVAGSDSARMTSPCSCSNSCWILRNSSMAARRSELSSTWTSTRSPMRDSRRRLLRCSMDLKSAT